jgi:hypothetical protein
MRERVQNTLGIIYILSRNNSIYRNGFPNPTPLPSN